ncbi:MULTISPECIES: NnrU family protein [Rhodomicrobium]|uniref:NnrU family protein n=1 Tax=Rhodomicrobium TaxID=1068 RepID=UPI000B4B1D6D|nr:MULTISPECIES: NnrU family protein [Rhodomicrobium]
MGLLALAGLVFLAIHIIPATPLRQTAVRALGEGGYTGLFSVLSLLSIWWWVNRFNNTTYDEAVWAYPQWWPWLKAALLLIAAILFVGGLSSPNPTLPQGGKLLERPDVGQGIFAITRHPLMWAFGVWGIAHLISQPNWRGLWFYGLFALTAIGGAALQERRKAAIYGASWDRFAAKTSFVPFLAILQGRARLSPSEIGWWRIGVAVLLWAMMLHLHPWLFGAAPLPGLG